MLEKLNSSTVGTFISTPFEGGTWLSICFNADRTRVSLTIQPQKYTEVWYSKWHDYPDVDSLDFSNKMSLFYVIRKTKYWHILNVWRKKLFKICDLITENSIRAFTRMFNILYT